MKLSDLLVDDWVLSSTEGGDLAAKSAAQTLTQTVKVPLHGIRKTVVVLIAGLLLKR